jgi:hypothetical protein
MIISDMRLQGPKGVVRDAAPNLSGMVGKLAGLKGDATHWLTGSECATLLHRLEDAHAAVGATLIEARRRVRLNERREEE